jgi:hypothetical protein
MRNFLTAAVLVVSAPAAAEPYGTPRTIEAGGSVGLTVATDTRDFNVAPQIGWFLAPNQEISAIVCVTRVADAMDTSTLFTALVEPSYHVPLAPRLFGFFGLGIGGTYAPSVGGGFAIAPRLGANVPVGGSGVITPSVSWQYATLGAASSLRLNLGYTVIW